MPSHRLCLAGLRPEVQVDVFSVETWDTTSHTNSSRVDKLVRFAAPYSASAGGANGPGYASMYANNQSYISFDRKSYYTPGWTFWAMPFGCMDTMDAADLGSGRMQPTRTESMGCEGFYIDANGYALNRDFMVPAYNMSDYYQIFPTWSDGANVAGYRRDKVSPVSFLPAARLAHHRTWTYGAPDFDFRPSAVTPRLVVVFHWDFSPRAVATAAGFEMLPQVGRPSAWHACPF